MPIYEYTCSACGHEFEKLRSMSRMDERMTCPECDGESKRQLSVFASFTTNSSGEMVPVSGGGGGCCGGGAGGCACSMGA
jgi:putative FmdB family regulatory protein